MAITKLTTTDFVVYTQKSMYIQTINFDGEIWEKQYLPELTFFYFEQNKIFEKKLKYITYILVLFILFNITSFFCYRGTSTTLNLDINFIWPFSILFAFLFRFYSIQLLTL